MFSFLKKSAPDTKAEVPAAPAPASAAPPAAAPTWRERLFKGLAKTRAQLGGKLKNIFSRGKVDDELLEELETLLLTSDVGMGATQHDRLDLQPRIGLVPSLHHHVADGLGVVGRVDGHGGQQGDDQGGGGHEAVQVQHGNLRKRQGEKAGIRVEEKPA